MTTYFCMRHGLTTWNQESRIQGNTDTELCDEGRDMAKKWAETLTEYDFDCILTSGLGRAKETAHIINEGRDLPVHEDARLNEQDWGDWTGKTKKELKEIGTLVRQQEKKGFRFQPPGGESRDDLLMRACDALIDFSEQHPGASVLVVTHNGVLKSLGYILSGLDFMPGDTMPLLPYTLHRIDCLDNELAIGELNMNL